MQAQSAKASNITKLWVRTFEKTEDSCLVDEFGRKPVVRGKGCSHGIPP